MSVIKLNSKNIRVYNTETIPSLIIDSVSLDKSNKSKLNVSVFINKAYCKHVIDELNSIDSVYISERRHKTITMFIKKSMGEDSPNKELRCFTRILEILGFNVNEITRDLKNELSNMNIPVSEVCYNYITFVNIKD